ncbi:hypothetical protein AOLI_G00155880 [Acnodon oligacanthus]
MPQTTRRPTPPAIQGCVLTSAPDQRRGSVSSALAQNAVLLIPKHIHHGRTNLRFIFALQCSASLQDRFSLGWAYQEGKRAELG